MAALPAPLSFLQSMAWLHGWVGLLPGWLLLLIFLFGTTAFLQQEISAWMRPFVVVQRLIFLPQQPMVG
ncbi:PepSY domain-containing protein [Sphingobium sufflavum]|uniref:PepSY domain-containing protein n=1 Tax=Sphingobium sufflavum TaxID=1129547 RepID=UPI002DD43E85|nr:PepSY domain-containing protein [Sphingobium sufflavum]